MREKAGVVRVREQHRVLLSGSYCAALLAVRAYIGQPLWAHSHTHWVIQSHLIRATEIQIQNISRFTEAVHFRSQQRGLILLVTYVLLVI